MPSESETVKHFKLLFKLRDAERAQDAAESAPETVAVSLRPIVSAPAIEPEDQSESDSLISPIFSFSHTLVSSSSPRAQKPKCSHEDLIISNLNLLLLSQSSKKGLKTCIFVTAEDEKCGKLATMSNLTTHICSHVSPPSTSPF